MAERHGGRTAVHLTCRKRPAGRFPSRFLLLKAVLEGLLPSSGVSLFIFPWQGVGETIVPTLADIPSGVTAVECGMGANVIVDLISEVP